jgi:hypothetical protein
MPSFLALPLDDWRGQVLLGRVTFFRVQPKPRAALIFIPSDHASDMYRCRNV